MEGQGISENIILDLQKGEYIGEYHISPFKDI